MEKLIGNRYEYRRPLGSGGMGSVFLSYDTKLNKYWAIKKCKNINDSEIDALKSIDTFFFPRIVDVIKENNSSYIVMDYVEGQTLTSYMNNHSLSEKEIIRIGIQIAKALEYLHKQIPTMLYMDCKPGNIMLTNNNEIRLVDLGSVYVCGSTSPQRISSTIAFASPEITNYSEDYIPSPSADIYSLGMTMYYMATGRSIEYRDRTGRLNVRWRNKNISPRLEYIIRKCTAAPSKRYQNTTELLAELQIVKANQLLSFVRQINIFDSGAYAILDIICKFTLAISILLWSKCANCLDSFSGALTLFIMVVLFLIICRIPRLNAVETKKNIFRGVGSRFLLTFLTCCIAMGSYAHAYSSGNSSLNVQLVDEYGRNLLIQDNYELTPKDSLIFSIPCKEMNPGVNTITIRCESGESVKEYSIIINNQCE